MKNGYRAIDADTHVNPDLEVLERYLDPSFRPRMKELEIYRRTTERDGEIATTLAIGVVGYPRKVGERPVTDLPDPGPQGQTSPLPHRQPQQGRTVRATGHNRLDPKPGVSEENAVGRLQDMDTEGRDVDILYPAPYFQYPVCLDDPTLAEGIWRGYHNYMREYCSANPKRLKGLAILHGGDLEWSLAELKAVANEPWLSAVWPILPQDMPLDHPDLEPMWAAINDVGVPVVMHAFFSGPPYWPGYRDMWDNAAIARTVAPHWLASRFFAYLICSGVFDRYPNMRAGLAEVGHGWVPHFLIRLEENINYVSGVVPHLKYKPIEYAHMGRLLCPAEPVEGPEMTKACFDLLGNNCLAHQSDYPHPGSYFPDTLEMVMNWPIWGELGEETKRRFFWDTPAAFFRGIEDL